MPPNFQFTDLNEMLADYFAKMQEVSGVSISYDPHAHTDWTTIPEHIGYEIYRIMQETIGNILKHTQAKQIHIQLKKKTPNLSFTCIMTETGTRMLIHPEESAYVPSTTD